VNSISCQSFGSPVRTDAIGNAKEQEKRRKNLQVEAEHEM